MEKDVLYNQQPRSMALVEVLAADKRWDCSAPSTCQQVTVTPVNSAGSAFSFSQAGLRAENRHIAVSGLDMVLPELIPALPTTRKQERC